MTFLRARSGFRINTDLVESLTPTTLHYDKADHKVLVATMASGARHVLPMTFSEYMQAIEPQYFTAITVGESEEPVRTDPEPLVLDKPEYD